AWHQRDLQPFRSAPVDEGAYLAASITKGKVGCSSRSRLMSLSFVIWPSVWPFDHWEVMAFWIAARSRITPFANDATRLFVARSIQASRSTEDLLSWKLSTTSLASASRRAAWMALTRSAAASGAGRPDCSA